MTLKSICSAFRRELKRQVQMRSQQAVEKKWKVAILLSQICCPTFYISFHDILVKNFDRRRKMTTCIMSKTRQRQLTLQSRLKYCYFEYKTRFLVFVDWGMKTSCQRICKTEKELMGIWQQSRKEKKRSALILRETQLEVGTIPRVATTTTAITAIPPRSLTQF